MASFDAWFSAAATAGLWICLGWLLVGFALALLAAVPGTVGRVCGRLAERISPRILRQLARCVTGLVLAVVSIAGAGTAASATAASQGPGWPSPSQSGAAALLRLPDLDRPTSIAGSWGSAGAPRPTGRSRLPTAMPPSLTSLPRLPTAPAQPAATAQPDSVRPGSAQPPSGQSESGKRAESEGRSPVEPPSRDRAVVVAPGDTLWDIAARELGSEPGNREIAERWPRWYASNRGVIGADPDLILPGQRLSPPS